MGIQGYQEILNPDVGHAKWSYIEGNKQSSDTNTNETQAINANF